MKTFMGGGRRFWARRVVGAAVLAASVNAIFWLLMRAALGPDTPHPTWFSFGLLLFIAVVAWPTFARMWSTRDQTRDRLQLTKLAAGLLFLALCLFLVNRLIQPNQIVGGALFFVVILIVSVRWAGSSAFNSWLGSGRSPELPPGPPVIINGPR